LLIFLTFESLPLAVVQFIDKKITPVKGLVRLLTSEWSGKGVAALEADCGLVPTPRPFIPRRATEDRAETV